MKKVLFVATVVKRHIVAFHLPYLEWFKNNGYEVHVCAHNDYEHSDDCMIPYCDVFHELPFNRSPLSTSNITAYKAFKDLVDTVHFDIIHCHTPVGGCIARIAARHTRKQNTKVIYTAHGFHFYKGARFINWAVYYTIERWLSRYTDLLITINHEDYQHALHFKAKHIRYVPGVGVHSTHTHLLKDKEDVRASMGVPPNAYCILSVGELSANKNHRAIIEAISACETQDIHYVICGEGPLKEPLLKLAEAKGIHEKVHFLGFRNDIHDIIRAVNLFVFPSFREGLSLALMEAMSGGIPVVVSGCRGNVDLVTHGYNGFVVYDNRIDEYTHYIDTLRNDANLCHQFIENSKVRIETYALPNVLKEMSELYCEVIEMG